MHMHVVRHAEAADQIKHRWMVADQMVQFDDARAIARKQARQGRQFVRNDVAQVGKAIRGAVADRDTARAIGCTRRPQHDGAIPAGAVPFNRGGDLALHTAACGMGDQDHRLAAAPPRAAPPRQVQPPARSASGSARTRAISSA